jgi:diguanylate cyclase (GGDEF)-like protein
MVYKKEEVLKFELHRLAERDELTGLYNRRMFRKHLKNSIVSGQRGIAVLIDIDDFKHVNDIHGHIFGDKMLIDFSNAMSRVIGESGSCYRFGGDEFLAIFEGDFSPAYIKKMAREMRESIQNDMASRTLHHITMSVGVVRYPEQGVDVNTLLKKADVAMYEAKAAGKNQMKQFVEDMLVVLDKKINIETHMKKGLSEDGFEMYYQPIVDAKTEEIVSFEALIRFKDKSFSPVEFIEVAETSGMIIPLGKWILEDILSTISKWLEAGYRVRPIAINLSPRQLLDPNFRVFFFDLLSRYDIDNRLVEIEITENILLDNEDENIEVLRDLRNSGITISMDDFGTGYSSLKYLTFLPIDKVKIDKSLKDQFMVRENYELLSSIIMMVHGLGYKVVAEGIETLEELEKLRKLNCDEIQGYYFSKPLPKEEIEKVLKKERVN